MTICNVEVEKIILWTSVSSFRDLEALIGQESSNMSGWATNRSAEEHVGVLLQSLKAAGVVRKLISAVGGSGVPERH